MVNSVNEFGLLLLNVVLQSTAIFAAGLLIARYLVRQPARVHAVLVLTFVAVIAAPAASEMVRQRGWGLLIPQTATSDMAMVAEGSLAATSVRASTANSPMEMTRVASSGIPAGGSPDADTMSGLASSRADSAATDLPAAERTQTTEAQPARSILSQIAAVAAWCLSAAWLGASLIMSIRLLRGALAGRRLLRTAEPCADPTVTAAIGSARQQLALDGVPVDVFLTHDLHCPVIWCWSKRPSLLLPPDAVSDWSTTRWTPILCHELAHWKRRDHYSALVAEIVCCLLPWQPLAWLAKRRLEEASELACDDWTVAAGHSACDYAETLLGLVPQPDPPLALAALRRRSGLAMRVRHILTEAMPKPRLGRAWAIAVLIATTAGVAATALCQRGVARAESPAPAVEGKAAEKSAEAKMAAASTGATSANNAKSVAQPKIHHKYTGRVLDPDGNPVPEADVIWENILRPSQENVLWPAPIEVSRTKTDAEGAFTLEADTPANAANHKLVIHAAEFGVLGHSPMAGGPMEIRIEPPYSVEGTIYTADGAAVKDARVMVRQISKRPASGEHAHWSVGPSDDAIKSGSMNDYWPAPVVTDAEGHFRFEKLVQRSATAELVVIAKEFPLARVYVAGPESIKYQDRSEITWREPTFTLVLENPLKVEGRFLDEKTGQPIKDVRVEVRPYSNHRGMMEFEQIEATSDDDGRYTMRAGSADMYMVKIIPPAGYPGFDTSISSRQIEQAIRATGKLSYELKLRPGLMLRGRVVDAEGGQPVAGADVVYQPTKGRKLGVNNDFRPVKTDDDGMCELTGVDGKGFLLVDAPDKGFYRLEVSDPRVPAIHDALYPHAFLEVDVPPSGPAEPIEIALHRGPKLVGRAIDPSGKPLTQFIAAYAGRRMDGYMTNEQVNDGNFHIDAAEPGRKYRVYLYSQVTNSGATVELVAPADGSVVEVKLEPCATIRGRYVYESGVPVPEIMNFTRFRADPDREPPHENARMNLPFYGNFAGGHDKNRTTDADGRFELGGIVPGAFLYLNTNFEFAADNDRSHPVGKLNPGEVKDVGELVLRPN